MIAQAYGHRFNHIDDANRYAQPVAFARLKGEKSGAGLDDAQRVITAEKKQTGYDPDGINKDGAKKEAYKAHLEKMFNIGGSSKPDMMKPKIDLKNEHLKNEHDGKHTNCPLCECETCKNRRYVDRSNDSAVSFQQPTKMRPEEAVHKVKAHEMEHVRREQYKAKQDGLKVVSQSVQIHTSICPECGKIYVSGGTTRTKTRYVNSDYLDLFRVGAPDMFKKGDKFTASA